MDYFEVQTLIEQICSDESTTFKQRTEQLFNKLNTMTRIEITKHVEYGGVIPESFSHDSSEEKLFAKYCDYLLARALGELGMKSKVIEERGDSADVKAEVRGYSLVGDAKAFRLSRTAKNQKDFKVEALNQWKKELDYACLVCPLYQYPAHASQIYDQAIRYNVTLLSFTHLGFLLKSENINAGELDKIWKTSGTLTSGKEAAPYWSAISKQVALAAGRSIEEWDKYLLESKKLLYEQSKKQLEFWESEKKRIRSMGHNEAVEKLISVLRIDSTITMITKTISDLEELIVEIN